MPFSSPRSSTPISLLGVSYPFVISAGRKLGKNGGRMFRGHYISSRTVHLTSPDSTRREECRSSRGRKPASRRGGHGGGARERERERDSDVVPTFSWNLVSSTRYFSPPLPSESSSFVFEQGSFVSVGRDSLDLRANPSMAAAVSPRYQLSRRRRRRG